MDKQADVARAIAARLPSMSSLSLEDIMRIMSDGRVFTMYKVRATPSRLWPVARRQQRQQRREQHQPELAVALGGSSCIA
jgi:hypothetical protein